MAENATPTKRFVYVSSASTWSKGTWNEGKTEYTPSAQETTYEKSIVFIEATQEIYTHGQYFGFTADEAARISDLESAIEALNTSYAFTSITGAGGTPVFSAAKGAQAIAFEGAGSANVNVSADGVKVTGASNTVAVAGSADAVANAAQAENGVNVNLVSDNNLAGEANAKTVSSSVKFTGSGSVKVTADGNGVITVAGDVDTLASGSANGTVAFNGEDVAVTGLGSAAYTDSDAYYSAGDGADLAERVDGHDTDISDLQDAVETAQETAEAKVASVSGVENNAVVVDNTDAKNPIISLKIAEGEGKAGNVVLEQGADGLKASISLDAQKVTMKTNTNDAYAGSYSFYQGGDSDANLIGTINIAKDMVVSDGTVATYTSETLPEGDDAPTEAGTYIVLTLANADNKKIYVKATDLIEYVTSGSETGDQVVVTVNPTTHKVTAAISAGTITETELNESVNASLDLADSALQSISIGDHTLNKGSNSLDIADLASDINDQISANFATAEQGETADSAVQKVTGSGFVSVADKDSNNEQAVTLTTQALASATAEADGLATAKDTKDYVDAVNTRINTLFGLTDEDTDIWAEL